MDKLTLVLTSPGGYRETLRQPRAANGGCAPEITLNILEVPVGLSKRSAQEVYHELVESYVAAWLVLVIVREHRRRKADRRRRGGGLGLGLASWTKYIDSATLGRQNERHASPRRSARPITTTAGGSKPCPSQAPSASQVNPAQIRSSIARPRHDGAITRVVQPNTRTIGTGAAGAGGKCTIEEPKPVVKAKPGTILDFLKLLDPPQSALLPLFIRTGVVGIAELSVIAHKAKWVYGWVKEDLINEFQFELIREGLQKLLEE